MHFNDAVKFRFAEPDIIQHCNQTKSGVDTVDHTTGTYNMARNNRRWPMVILYTTGGKHEAHRPNPALPLVLSGPAPCFYPAAALSSCLTVKRVVTFIQS